MLRARLAKRMGWYPASELSIQIGTAFAVLFLIASVPLRAPTLGMVGAFLRVALATERRRLWWMMANDLGWRVQWQRPRWGV